MFTPVLATGLIRACKKPTTRVFRPSEHAYPLILVGTRQHRIAIVIQVMLWTQKQG
jgi:hypothetical protein